MRKQIIFLIFTITSFNAFAQYSAKDSTNAKFFINRRHYADVHYPLGAAIHHAIVQSEGCNGEWGIWMDIAGIELGMGFDGNRYKEEKVGEERLEWFGGQSYKVYTEYKGIHGSDFTTYLGAYIRNWISVGAVMDCGYGAYSKTKVQYVHGYGIGSDFDYTGPVIENSYVSWGVYAKLNFQFKKYYNIFLLGRACLNGNNALALGCGLNF